MARSTDLRTEASAMARIEAAYASLDELPDPAMKRRVLRYAAETYKHPDVPKLIEAVRRAVGGTGLNGVEPLESAAVALANALDPPADAD